jgi:hypothetical protein
MEHAQLRQTALDDYRRLVALLYREIGVLRTSNHALASKAKKNDALFCQARKQRAKDIYRVTLSQTDPAQIAAEYHTLSGLTLQDLHEAFANGRWAGYDGRCSYGGPRWATIADTTINLGNALQQQAWNDIPPILDTIKTLQHNNGYITEKYPQLD